MRFLNARNFGVYLRDFCPLFCTWIQSKFNEYRYPTAYSVYCELDVWHAFKEWYLKQAGNLYSTLYFVQRA